MALVLRDMIFMMMIVSAIFVLSGLFVSEMAFNYENTNMSNEWGLTGTNSLANSTFYSTGDDVTATGQELASNATGIFALIDSGANVLKGIGGALFMVLTAPNTVGDLVSATLEDMGVAYSVANIIKYLLVIVLWAVIIFTIASSFLRGGKL